ncbi:putative MFS transporter [Xylariales sp. PMI_506]|nr:putative MFS transporter [Xylariales sp. PMI_506]
MANPTSLPWGFRWRSSKSFIIFTISLSLFTEMLLYSFIVPILSYMIEGRLGLAPRYTQRYTSALLFSHGIFSVISGPIIAHYADKTPYRKMPLLASLFGGIVGTIMLAWARSVWVMFVGRILQATAGSAAWIICLATLADVVGPDNIGKALGSAMSFVTAGITMGPVISGAALQLWGYWPTWSVPLALLGIDLVARLLMLERRDLGLPSGAASEEATSGPPMSDVAEPRVCSESTTSETSSLLSDGSSVHGYQSIGPLVENPVDPTGDVRMTGFYRVMLRDPSVLAALFSTMSYALAVSGFNATIPLHLRDRFGWGTLPSGMIFLSLQVPGIILGPLVGWIRDRVGARLPTTVGWVLWVPFLLLAGVPAEFDLSWTRPDASGTAIFILAMISIGLAGTLIRGAGAFHLAVVANDLIARNPTVFGAHGGQSRIFATAELGFNCGIMIGPILCGSLRETAGFFYTNCTLAGIAAVAATTSYIYMKPPRKD